MQQKRKVSSVLQLQLTQYVGFMYKKWDVVYVCMYICTYYNTSWPPQEKLFIWPPFSQYNKHLLRQKTGGTSLYMPQDSHWLASFEVIPPPQKVSFPPAKKMKIPHRKLFS